MERPCRDCGVAMRPEDRTQKGTWRCKPCRNAIERAQRAENAAAERARIEKYRAGPKYAEWLAENREHILELGRARGRRFRAQHPDRAAHNSRRYRDRKRGADGSHSLSDWRRLLSIHSGLCFYRKTSPATCRDHVVPLIQGGSNYIGNLVPSCTPCNQAKGGRTIMQWRVATRGK